MPVIGYWYLCVGSGMAGQKSKPPMLYFAFRKMRMNLGHCKGKSCGVTSNFVPAPEKRRVRVYESANMLLILGH